VKKKKTLFEKEEFIVSGSTAISFRKEGGTSKQPGVLSTIQKGFEAV